VKISKTKNKNSICSELLKIVVLPKKTQLHHLGIKFDGWNVRLPNNLSMHYPCQATNKILNVTVLPLKGQ